MSKLILHVGTHKTGTTTTQDTLALNRDLLEQNGLIYPEIGTASGQHALVTDWIKLPKQYHINVSAEDAWRALGREHGKSDRTVLISTEELSRGNPNMRVDMAVLRELCSVFDDVKIICLLRNQAAFIQSIYLQVVKNAPNIPWGPFFKRAVQQETASGLFLDYADLRKFFETGFPGDEINFFSYEQVCRDEHGVIGLILKECGYESLIHSLQSLPDGYSNVSPDPLATWVASRILGPRPLEPWLVQIAREAFLEGSKNKEKTTLFTRAEYDRVTEVFSDKNLAFEKNEQSIGRPIKIAPFNKDDNVVYRSDLTQDFWVRVARNLCKVIQDAR